MTTRYSFATRLQLARRLLAHAPASVPGHTLDQLDAAGRDTRKLHDHMAAVLPLLEPDRSWRQRMDTSPSEAVRAHLLAAMLDCQQVCPHLRKGGPQPAIAQLPLHRVDCLRCAGTVRRPPPDEDDRCDICGQRGIVTFHPFAVRQGPLLAAGDACGPCAAVLGIIQEAASA